MGIARSSTGVALLLVVSLASDAFANRPTPPNVQVNRTLTVLVDFADVNVPCTRADTQQRMYGASGVAGLFRDMSAGQLEVQGQVVGPYRISYRGRDDNGNPSPGCVAMPSLNEALEMSRAEGINPADYQTIAFISPPKPWCERGFAVPGNPGYIVTTSCEAIVYAHEFGHDLFWGHAGNETGQPYGDTSSIMGSGGLGMVQASAPHQAARGWKTPVAVTASGNFRISPLELAPSAAAYPQILKIARGTANQHLYLSYRQPIGPFDIGLSGTRFVGGVSIHRMDEDLYQPKTTIASVLADGGVYEVPANAIRVTQIGHDANSVTLAIALDGVAPPDTLPPVTSIVSPTMGARVVGRTNIVAAASDNVRVTRVEFFIDGVRKGVAVRAPYSYSWNAMGFANGPHTLQVKASDSSGNVGVSSQVTVQVMNAGDGD